MECAVLYNEEDNLIFCGMDDGVIVHKYDIWSLRMCTIKFFRSKTDANFYLQCRLDDLTEKLRYLNECLTEETSKLAAYKRNCAGMRCAKKEVSLLKKSIKQYSKDLKAFSTFTIKTLTLTMN